MCTRRTGSLPCRRTCPKVLGQRRFDKGSVPLSCLKDSSSVGQMWRLDVDREKAVDLMPSKHILLLVQALQKSTLIEMILFRPAYNSKKSDIA